MAQLSRDLKVIQDVETRWWSTFAMVVRLLYLRRAIRFHEQLDGIPPLLSEFDGMVLELLAPVLEPFMTAQKELSRRAPST